MHTSTYQAKKEICEMVSRLKDENCQEVLSFMKRIQNIERDREKYHSKAVNNYA